MISRYTPLVFFFVCDKQVAARDVVFGLHSVTKWFGFPSQSKKILKHFFLSLQIHLYRIFFKIQEWAPSLLPSFLKK